MDDLTYWLALHRAPGIGAATFSHLLSLFDSPRTVFELPRQAAAEAGLSPAARAYLEAPDWAAVEQDRRWAEEADNHILRWDRPDYPQRLAAISDAPPLLFVHGDPALLGEVQLAMVGSRNPTAGGRDTAFQFARHLSEAGLVITSGLAMGIDAAAHRGALEGNGLSVAVTGTGLDRVYPARHRDLAHAIVDRGGALVSEWPLGTPPRAQNFPRRNRIISGLCVGTLVVEAARRSGSLIMAAEQGREVFAIPGSIHSPLVRGCHQLIKQGAKLVESSDDILEEIAHVLRLPAVAKRPSVTADSAADDDKVDLDADYQRVLDSLGFEPTPIDVVIERSGLTTDAVSSMLLVLELHGQVTSAPGGVYSRSI